MQNIGNWGEIDVDTIDKDHPGTGNICQGPLEVPGTQRITWKCGLPKVGTALFGLGNFNPVNGGGYTGGQCTAHVVQYQKNEDGVGAQYEFDYELYDNDHKVIASVSRAVVDPVTRQTVVRSALPFGVTITAGAVDSDPVSFNYNQDIWSCGAGVDSGNHHCTLGNGKHNGYENGNREGDMNFPC